MPDVLVIFGAAIRPDGQPSGTLRRRVDGACRLGRSLGDPLYLVTGGVGRYGPAEAIVMKAQLVAAEVPPDRVIVEDQGTDTLSSAIRCWRLLRGRRDLGRVFVCSSPYHIPRCRMLLRILGLPAVTAPMPGDRAALGTWKWLWYVFREMVAAPYDAFLLLLRKPFLTNTAANAG